MSLAQNQHLVDSQPFPMLELTVGPQDGQPIDLLVLPQTKIDFVRLLRDIIAPGFGFPKLGHSVYGQIDACSNAARVGRVTKEPYCQPVIPIAAFVAIELVIP